MNESSFNETRNITTPLIASSPALVEDSTKFAINAAFIASGVFGIVGNLVALIVIYTHKPLRKRLSNYFFINKTIVDLLVSILLVPTIVPTYSKTSYLFCLLWNSRAIFLGIFMTSVYSIVLLAIERFLEVVYPIKHRLNVTKCKVFISIAIAWAIGFGEKFALCMSPVRWSESTGCSTWYPSANARMAAGIMNFISEYCLPLILIGMCYMFMAVSLHNKAKVHHRSVTVSGIRGAGGQSKTGFGLSRAKKNILITMIIIVAFFIALNTYKQSLLVLSYTGRSGAYSNTQFSLAQIFSFLNATIDPYIYLVSHKEFRVGFTKLFRCVCKTTAEESAEETANKNGPSVVVVAAVKQDAVKKKPARFTVLPAHSSPTDPSDQM